MDSLVTQARGASRNPSDCRGAIDALRATGFCNDAFKLLHHQQGSVARFYAYCKSVQQFVEDGNNHRVHQRLKYVVLLCPAGAPPEGETFQTLAKEAFRLIPPSK
jgi:hypothetical protein